MLARFVMTLMLIVCSTQSYAVNRFVDRRAPANNTVCTFTSPCRSFEEALAQARVGDTIICLTPPEFARANITFSITIDCSSVRSISQDSSYDAHIIIDIPAGVASDPLRTVRLRGLTLEGSRQADSFDASGRFFTRGIEIKAAASVFIEDCIISNTKQQGIYDHRTGGQTRLYVKDTVISNNGGPGVVAASQGPAATVLDNVSLLNNTFGVAVATGNNVVVTRSTISGNTTAGVHADGGAQINLSNSTLSHNTTNVNAIGTIRLKDNEIQFSNLAINGSAAISLGANRFSGNGALGAVPASASGAPADVFN